MKHTKITKKNVGAAIRDDKAHMDYLKRDINYDAKHGHSDINMTADEKHISKLAGDVISDKSFLSKHYTHNRVFSHGGPEMFKDSYGGESVELKDQMSPVAMMESPVEYGDTPMEFNEGFESLPEEVQQKIDPQNKSGVAKYMDAPMAYKDGEKIGKPRKGPKSRFYPSGKLIK